MKHLTDGWWLPDGLHDGITLSSGLALRIEAGKVAELGRNIETATALSGILTPCFFDIQVNGGAGLLVNQSADAASFAKIAAAHRIGGTGHWLPTVITDRRDAARTAAEAVISAIGRDGVAGLHLEGPHIAPTRRGTHDATFIRPMDEDDFAALARLRDAEIPTLVTVAPECVTPIEISRMAEMGVVVSLGHSDATAETVAEALSAGARAFTHLFNAMSPLGHRAPGMVGAALASDAWCSIIADGHHVDEDMLGVAVRARKLANRMILISDAMPSLGGPARFDLYGRDVRLEDGRLINKDGALAGAQLYLFDALRLMVTRAGVDIEAAIAMLTGNPAHLMGLYPRIGGVPVGAPLDALLIDQDLGSFERATTIENPPI